MRSFPELVISLGKIAEYALLAEVRTTPKPGLVDYHDSGSHSDMNYDTFIASTMAIVPYLTEMAYLGYTWTQSPQSLFQNIRPIGIEAEKAMFKATNGVNTHKGIIFSLGIIMAVSGWTLQYTSNYNPQKVLELCGTFTYDVLEHDFSQMNLSNPKTHGEKLYALTKLKGIRGEVQNGFPSVSNFAFPVMNYTFKKTTDENAVYLETLLTLMTIVDDTNVLIRTDNATLAYVKKEAKRILDLGGYFTEAGKKALIQMNLDFISKNISSGGCADLLAVTIFLYRTEQNFSPVQM